MKQPNEAVAITIVTHVRKFPNLDSSTFGFSIFVDPVKYVSTVFAMITSNCFLEFSICRK